MIPRSSSVVAKRVPATRPGKGKAASYLTGDAADASTGTTAWSRNSVGAMSKRFDGKSEDIKGKSLVSWCPASVARLDAWVLGRSVAFLCRPIGRACGNGIHVQGNDRSLGGNTRENDSVGVALCAFVVICSRP